MRKSVDRVLTLARRYQIDCHRSRGGEDMIDKMEELGMAVPKPTVDLAEIRREYHAAEREQGRLAASNADKPK
jgi:hypothetical protein